MQRSEIARGILRVEEHFGRAHRHVQSGVASLLKAREELWKGLRKVHRMDKEDRKGLDGFLGPVGGTLKWLQEKAGAACNIVGEDALKHWSAVCNGCPKADFMAGGIYRWITPATKASKGQGSAAERPVPAVPSQSVELTDTEWRALLNQRDGKIADLSRENGQLRRRIVALEKDLKIVHRTIQRHWSEAAE